MSSTACWTTASGKLLFGRTLALSEFWRQRVMHDAAGCFWKVPPTAPELDAGAVDADGRSRHIPLQVTVRKPSAPALQVHPGMPSRQSHASHPPRSGHAEPGAPPVPAVAMR